MAPAASGKRRWLSTLPSDQLRVAMLMAARPTGEAVNAAPRISSSTPRKPTIMPVICSRPGRMPRARLNSEISAGITATKVTTSPEGTVCSA